MSLIPSNKKRGCLSKIGAPLKRIEGSFKVFGLHKAGLELYSCFDVLGVLLVGVLLMRALLGGVYSRPLIFARSNLLEAAIQGL